MSTEYDNTFNAYSLGIQRTLRLNDLIHFFLSALTSPAGGNFTAAILFLFNKRSRVLQGMLGITEETSLFALHPEAPLDSWRHPRITSDIQRRQRDDDFNRAAIRLRFHLVGTTPITTACKEGISRSLTESQEENEGDEIAALFNHFFATRQYTCIPLSGREGLIGALVLTSNEEPLMATRIAEAEAYTQHAEVAIDNVLLLRRLESANEELRGLEARAQQDEKMALLGELVASIAHDLKNPMIAIGGFARRLERLVAGEEACYYVETIKRESRRLEEIVGGILSFSRKQMICYDSCDLPEFIGALLAKEEQSLAQANIHVEIKADAGLPVVFGDAVRLSQLFTNLIQNATQAMPKGGKLTLRLKTVRLLGDRAVQIEVEDSGAGIPKEVIDSIFKPFFTTRAEGTGLGLAICARTVEQHQGKIRALNSPTGGAIFRVTLPVQRRR
uniref:histidine kinase n=1 Tax=uncultured bacterium pAY4-1 TaxID=1781157 RepID=A0A1C9U4U0_9BACT|nr:histidine kinase [uncultured bacterium pAY4-1]